MRDTPGISPTLLETLQNARSNSNGTTKSVPKRLKIWEMRSQVECSVIGTCLTERDLRGLLKKLKLQPPADFTDHDLHAYFVKQIVHENIVSRSVQKLLDKRHAGVVRRVGRIEEQDELSQLWDKEFSAGRIPGAYWAFQTHSHIPQDLHVRIFGEVHMLSHVLGRTIQRDIEQIADLENQVADLESRLSRERQRHAGALAARDKRISKLETLRTTVVEPCLGRRQVGQSVHLSSSRTAKQARALSATRERLRRAEADAEAAKQEAQALRRAYIELLDIASATDEAPPCPGAQACRIQVPDSEPVRVLYLGGRTGAIDHLRSIAESASAELHHHDGGKQESFARIGDLIDHCHVVFCPVNCISHRACLFAKERCRKLERPFVPLRTTGAATFRRALEELI